MWLTSMGAVSYTHLVETCDGRHRCAFRNGSAVEGGFEIDIACAYGEDVVLVGVGDSGDWIGRAAGLGKSFVRREHQTSLDLIGSKVRRLLQQIGDDSAENAGGHAGSTQVEVGG